MCPTPWASTPDRRTYGVGRRLADRCGRRRLGAIGSADRAGAVGAALTLALSPLYLLVSRQALPEALAVAFIAAAGAAAEAYRRGHRSWRVLSGALLGLACLVKPLVFPGRRGGHPALRHLRRSRRSSMLAPGRHGLGRRGRVTVLGGLTLLDQVVTWRLQAGQFSFGPVVVQDNFELLLDKMWLQEQPPFYLLAATGGACADAAGARAALAMVIWSFALLILLLGYGNLSSHLGVFLLVPLAILAGVRLGNRAGPLWRRFLDAASIGCPADRCRLLAAARRSQSRPGISCRRRHCWIAPNDWSRAS